MRWNMTNRQQPSRGLGKMSDPCPCKQPGTRRTTALLCTFIIIHADGCDTGYNWYLFDLFTHLVGLHLIFFYFLVIPERLSHQTCSFVAFCATPIASSPAEAMAGALIEASTSTPAGISFSPSDFFAAAAAAMAFWICTGVMPALSI